MHQDETTSPDAKPETPPPGIQLSSFTNGDVTVPFAVYRPQGLPADTKAPAILFLHGWGESGTNGTAHLTTGLPPAIFRNPDRWPFVVIMPQKPIFNREWDEFHDEVITILDQQIEAHNLDPDRIAITGLSQGGHATIMLTTRNPDRFVAAAPVCGYTDRRMTPEGTRIPETAPEPTDPGIALAADAMSKLPTWIFHGQKDNVVPPEQSVALHEALKQRDAPTRLTMFPNADHNSWDPAYNDPELAAWFQKHLGVD